jgi:Ca2+-binding EF-hand superfamily protein
LTANERNLGGDWGFIPFMKPISFRRFAIVAALLPTVALAAPGGKRPPNSAAHHGGPMAEVLKSFDKNGNHRIDADELPALQQTYSTLKNLDKNANGEIELAEAESPKTHGTDDRKGRMMAGFKRVDKNGNHKIDSDEIEGLQKMLAGGKIMSRLDHNSNGKIDPDELEHLNQRIAQGSGKGPSSSAPTLRKPPAKPAKTAPPAATPKTEEKKPETPAFETKPPGNFGK